MYDWMIVLERLACVSVNNLPQLPDKFEIVHRAGHRTTV